MNGFENNCSRQEQFSEEGTVKLSVEHRQHVSEGLRRYWNTPEGLTRRKEMKKHFYEHSLGKWLLEHRKTENVHRVDRLTPGMKPAISYFARKVVGKTGMEWSDVTQELRICLWLSEIRYHQEHPPCPLRTFLMSNLYFQHLTMIKESSRHKKLENKAIGRFRQSLPSFVPDHSEEILDEIDRQQHITKLPEIQRKVVLYRMKGFNQTEIGKLLGLNQSTVSRALQSVA